MRHWLLLVGLAVLAGCSPSSPTVPLDQEFTLAPGDAVGLANTGFSIRFLAVSGDSRCPLDALCIQAGDGVVRISVSSGDRELRQYELHTADGRPAVHEGITISLLRLMPYPSGARTIQPADYRATLRAVR